MLSSPSPIFFILVLSLSVSLTSALPTNIWHVSIDEGPAPPPDKGPPLSANASRDTSIIPYQVAGIVAAYILCLAVATVSILIAKRHRRKTQTSDQSLSMEMLKPSPKVHQAPLPAGPTPLSPRREGYKPWSTGHNSKQSQISVSTVDEKIVEQDKAKNMEEMEKLYAAVMAHDDHPSQQAKSGTSQPMPQIPTELQHLRDVRPADEALPHPMAPTPIEEDFQGLSMSKSSVKSKPSPMSLLHGHSRGDSANSTRSRPSRLSIRGSISNPMGSPDLRDSVAYSEEAPLSPRLYTPGPPPPIPSQKSAAAQAREIEAQRRARGTPASNSSANLPFRQAYADSMKSAPPTKTTFLDKRELQSGPKTGVPFTPYSPYMPYTPLTPVTPRRLVTKNEMKRDKKKGGMKVVTEDDIVLSDDDMWSTVR